MRLLRWVSVMIGAVLIVTVVAGYAARSAELARERDLWVETTAQLAASELAAVASAVDTAAELAVRPAAAARVLTTAPRPVVACASSGTTGTGADIVCALDGGTLVVGPPDSLPETARLVEALGDRLPVDSGWSDVVDGELVLVRSGPDVTVALSTPVVGLRSPISSAAGIGDVAVGLQPVDGRRVDDSAVATAGDRRESTRLVPGVPGWVVVASAPADVALDPAERNALLFLMSLAVVLLILVAITIVTDRRHLVERASLDPLTRLPNRGEFELRGDALVETAVRGGEGACLMLVDLDGFKEINDTHGHQAGDEILKVVGMRLRNAVRGYDLVARWGGDEFVLVLQGIDDEQLAATRAAALAKLVAEPLRAGDNDGGLRLQVGASVGVAILGVHGADITELVEAADAAMYEAKRAGEPYRMAAYAGERAVLDPA